MHQISTLFLDSARIVEQHSTVWAALKRGLIKPLFKVQRMSKNDPSLKQALGILHLSVAE